MFILILVLMLRITVMFCEKTQEGFQSRLEVFVCMILRKVLVEIT